MQDINGFLRGFSCLVKSQWGHLRKAFSQLYSPSTPRLLYIFGTALSVNEWAGAAADCRATHEALQVFSLSLSLPFLLLSPFGELQWDDDRNQLTGNIISSALALEVGKYHKGWVKLAPIH